VTEHSTSVVRAGALLLTAAALVACSNTEAPGVHWSLEQQDLPGALVSVWGSRHDDVWIVGGDRGQMRGPTVLHFDGARFETLSTGETEGDLWWVTGAASGPVYMAGKDGLVLRVRVEDRAFERIPTPSTGTVFGLWAASADDVWAVGGDGATGAFAWRLADGRFQPVEGFPAEVADGAALRKVWGTSPRDVWLVGTRGTTLHYDGESFDVVSTPKPVDLFTVHALGDRVVTVGGEASGTIYELDHGAWKDVTPVRAPELTGVWLHGEGGGYAVGGAGNVYSRQARGWVPIDTGDLVSEDLHSVWVDPEGCVFAAGGRWRAYPLIRGLLLYGCDQPLVRR
jgi:hypothetical protein